ncbi:hypothetical protein LDENG_00267340, partial [Lucifuga dentata]
MQNGRYGPLNGYNFIAFSYIDLTQQPLKQNIADDGVNNARYKCYSCTNFLLDHNSVLHRITESAYLTTPSYILFQTDN